MAAIVIAVSQGKGGATKTTTSINLAGAFIELGFKTLVCDWDINKPDASEWMKKGECIEWVKLIENDTPIEELEALKSKYQIIIYDTPPNYEQNAFKAVMAADFVIIPTTVNFLDQDNAKKAISLPMLAKKPFKILMSKVRKGTRASKEIEERVGKQDICFNTIITDRHVMAQCPEAGKWIGQFSKGSDSHKQYTQLACEVAKWIGVVVKGNLSSKQKEFV